jgi:asparaginyl-tRNA synthetase
MSCCLNRRKETILLKSEVLKSLRDFMDQEGFVEEDYEGITNATGSCESIANIFVLKGSENFLTLRQTAQLFLEDSIVTCGLPRMYTLGRSFRKDRVGDGRHLNDFTLLEFEALDTDLEWLLKFNNDMMEHVIKHVLRVSSRYGLLTPQQHSVLYGHWKRGIKTISYSQAISTLQSFGITNSEGKIFQWGDDLSAEAERVLTNLDGMLQVVRYPEEIKFFNMKRSKPNVNSQHYTHKDFPIDSRSTVECVDLLLPKAGETFGGSQREDDYSVLVDKLDNSTMLNQLSILKQDHDGDGDAARKAFDDYLELFKEKVFVRSGAGVGLGRLLQFLMNSEGIIPF